MTQPKDYSARIAAAIAADYNVIVEAGAGTGKTTILITRMCYLILGQDVPIDKVVALTFTEKAASEIKIRLLLKMQKILAALETQAPQDEAAITLLNHFGKTKEELQSSIQTAFELAERAQISTIHSFCLQILRRYPIEAGLAPQAQVDDGTITQTIFDKEWAAFLESELVFESANSHAWASVLQVATLEDIKDFTQTLLNPALKGYHPFKNAQALKQHALNYAALALELSERYPAKKKRTLELNLEQAAGMLKESAQFFTDLKPVKSAYAIEKAATKPANWEEEDFEKAKAAVAFALALQTDNQLLILKAFKLIEPFIENMRAIIQKENIISYDGLIALTLALLKNNKSLRQELKKNYKSILIDEFQDTDPAQGEILLYLCETLQTAANTWQDIKLAKGKLFTVGDPKQSIYRFRGADITAYEKFTDLMLSQGAKKCYLQTNFRSSKQIIAFANAFGQKAIREQSGLQPKYVAIDNGKDFEAPHVNIALIDDVENQTPLVNEYRHNQAQYIAAWIRDNAGKTKLSNGQVMRYKDIAILLRTTTALDVYRDALKRFDIKYTVEETKNFYAAQEVSDIINILKVLNDPGDKTALLAVLRSPLAMLEDTDILALSRCDALNIFADIPQNPKAAAVYKMLKDLHYKAGRVPLDTLLAEVIYNTGLIELETIATQREQTIANIFKFMDVLRKTRSGKALSLGQFLYHAETYSKEQNREGESTLAEESLDTVSIMTMHKSKGLEFPVVILTDISKKERHTKARRANYLYSWQENMQGIRLGAHADGTFALLEETAKSHQAAEEQRILYVALTRAKECLLLVGDLKDDKNTIAASLQAAGCWPSAELKPHTLLEAQGKVQITYTPYQAPEMFIDTQYFTQSEGDTPFDIPAWLESWQKRTLTYKSIINKKATLTPSSHEEDDTTPKIQRDAAAAIGSLCHRMLFNIFINNPRTPDEAALEENLNPADCAAQIKEAQAIINKFTASALFNNLKDMQLLAAEMPFTVLAEDGGVINGIIDAVFKTKDGKIFIADYKSDNINSNEIQSRSVYYKPQLDLYKTALAKIFENNQIEAAVIYLRLAAAYKV